MPATIVFHDGFDGYTNLDQIWDQQLYQTGVSTLPVINSTAGRHGNGVLLTDGGCLYKSLPSDLASVGLGFAFRCVNTPPAAGRAMISLRDEGSVQMTVTMTSGMKITLTNGSNTLIGTTTTTFLNNTWYYLELALTIATAGSYTLNVDGRADISGSGVKTKGSGNDYVNFVRFGSSTAGNYPFHYDDIYISTGGLTGPAVSQSQRLNGGVPGKMTLSYFGVGSLYQALASQDSEYGYAAYNEPGVQAFGEVENTENTGGVYAVTVRTLARKEYGNTRAVVNALYPREGGGATVYSGGTHFLGTTTRYFADTWSTNPATGGTFTYQSFNDLRVGMMRYQ